MVKTPHDSPHDPMDEASDLDSTPAASHSPRLGDQVLAPPGSKVVSDPKTPSGLPIPGEPPLTHDPNVLRRQADEHPSDLGPAESIPVPKVSEKEKATSILLENGTRVALSFERPPKEFRLRDDSGQYYEHCAEGPGGEWVYRPTK